MSPRFPPLLLCALLCACSSAPQEPLPERADASGLDMSAQDMSALEPVRADMADMGRADMKPPQRSLLHATPQDCGECHRQHLDEWEGSMHAYATRDPIFLAMLNKGIQDTQGKLDQFCIQCHAPVASKLGDTPVVQGEDDIWRMPLAQKSSIHDGVVCVTCHATASVEATLNAKFTLTDTTLFGPTGSPASQAAHPMQQSDLLTQSLVCGSCHNVVNPKGALLENTFSEWYAGPFNAGGDQDKSCQDCHMPAYEGEVVPGTRRTLHRHTFVGVDVALIEDFPDRAEQLALVEALLKSAATLELEQVPDQQGALALRASVRNVNNGHALPSGSTADRQVWVHLTVRDQDGGLVHESGMLDARGDLMDRVEGHSLDPGGDPELLLFGSLLFDEQGEHVTFPWEAKRSQDFLIQPGQLAWREYLIERASLRDATALTVEARLLYRTFPPFLVRALEQQGYLEGGALSAGIPIMEMARQTMMISL